MTHRETALGRARGPALVVALAAAAALAGCGSRPDVLARVGDQVITTEDFLVAARGAATQYAGPADSAKAQLLNDLVTRALMLDEARRRLGPGADSVVGASMRDARERTLTTALLQRMVPSDIPVSDAEVDSFYRWRARESHVQVVFVTNHDAANAALAELRRGTPFEQVADRFNLSGMLPPHGDLGWVAPGALVQPLDDLVRTAPTGVVQGPVEAPGEGLFLVRVAARRPRHQPPLANERGSLSEVLRQRKRRELQHQVFETLRREYQVSLEPGGAQALFERWNVRPDSTGRRHARDVDSTRVLGRYLDGRGGGATYTMKDALSDLRDVAGQRPDFSLLPMVQQWIENRIVQRVAVIEARRRHLDQEPDVAVRLRESVNNRMVNDFYASAVLAQSVVGPEDVAAAYERRKSALVRIDRAVVRVATFDDSAAAVAGMAGGGTTGGLAALGGAREQTVTYPTTDARWKQLQPVLLQTPEGAVTGPFRVQGGWLVLQVVSKRQGPRPLAALDSATLNALRNDALEFKRDRRLRELTDSLRARIRPVVYRQRLRGVPWPGPGAAGADAPGS